MDERPGLLDADLDVGEGRNVFGHPSSRLASSTSITAATLVSGLVIE